MSLVVYTGATPNGWKITIMIEELIEAGIDLGRVEIRQLSLSDGDQFTENFTNINPNQKIPAIVHNGTHVFEGKVGYCNIELWKYDVFLFLLTWRRVILWGTFWYFLAYSRELEGEITHPTIPVRSNNHPSPLTRSPADLAKVKNWIKNIDMASCCEIFAHSQVPFM